MTASESRQARILAWLRANSGKLMLEVLANFALPFAIYSYAAPHYGPARALMASMAPPIIWSVFGFIRERRVDAISILVLGGIGLSLLAFAGGGGVQFLQLRENLVTGLVGLVFLGSAAIGRPLIFELAKAGARRGSAERAATVEALGRTPEFRRVLTATTLFWGVGLLAVCAVNCALVFMLSIKQFMLVSGPISWALAGLMTLWTYWRVPRALRLAQARAKEAS